MRDFWIYRLVQTERDNGAWDYAGTVAAFNPAEAAKSAAAWLGLGINPLAVNITTAGVDSTRWPGTDDPFLLAYGRAFRMMEQR